MTNLEKTRIGDQTNYVLDGKAIANGDEVELRLRGNRGWASVEIEGLPDRLSVRFTNDIGTVLNTTMPPDAELRWP